MSSEDLYNAITDIDESLIIEADNYVFYKKNKVFPILLSLAAAVIIAVAVSSVMRVSRMPVNIPGLNELTSENENISFSEEITSENETAGEEYTTENTSELTEETTNAQNLSENEATTEANRVTDHSAENKKTIKPTQLSKASYPDMAKYPNTVIQYGPLFELQYNAWREDIRELYRIEVDADNVRDFSSRIAEKFLAVSDDKNKAVSPLNIYMSLSLLAECTDNTSRQQILSLLGVNSVEELRTQAQKLWKKNYRDDGYMKSILANSLWLNNSIKYKGGLLDTVSEKYFAAVFYGTTGTETFDKMLNNWIRDNTGKQLSPDLKMSEDTVFTIVSTLLYQTKWSNEFSRSDVEKGTFHAPDKDSECEFLTRETNMTYYWGERFAAISLGLDIGGEMWFILPDEGVDADSIFADGEVTDFLDNVVKISNEQYENSKYLIVNMKIPKFDITCDTDLTKGLTQLGITDAMNPLKADFSPLAENYEGIYADEFKHSMRVKIDEEGVSAAAYTAIIGAGAAAPPDERVDFILDRPFAFAVTLDNETILFAGVVNNP